MRSKDRTVKVKVGDIFETRTGTCKVVEYHNSTNIVVEFLDENKYQCVTSYQQLKLRHTRNVFCPSLCGVGFSGEGIYSEKDDTYYPWYHMIRDAYKDKNNNDCTVYEGWHNFQVFSEWYAASITDETTNYFVVDANTLNKPEHYSPESCLVLPSILASAVKIILRKSGKNLPIGVSQRGNKESYKATMTCGGKNKHLGTFKTSEEASAAYVIAKEAYVKELALEWKDKIEPRAFQALMNWTVY